MGSLPLPGAWIEISADSNSEGDSASLPLPGAWIEIPSFALPCFGWQSLPLPGAWIEILTIAPISRNCVVAPFTGSVD